ncbi:MAG: histidinol dehydrogenase [Fimbriimonadaceae bacterium]|nr:histidinol dehydrogenase [Fimbriimonadaceae bacterium]QYK59155.1 MAG: histidinol dehydrogenase [Fimbriimonadaceae bacterium]
MSLLRRLTLDKIPSCRRPAVPDAVLAQAAGIVRDVREGGEAALRNWAERLGDLEAEGSLFLDRKEIERRAEELDGPSRAVIQRAAGRIREFAERQRTCLGDLDAPIAGGRAGHRIVPVEAAGCYAPGGRYPLPSSALMTAVTARAAGVERVWLASPRPTAATLAAAAEAGVDGVLCAGGAQAVAALAYGAGPLRAVDVVAGPGNHWVTAAKKLVSGDVAIDMLAGPSELVVVADEGADPAWVSADLLAQAEHDTEARPILVALSGGVIDAVESELARQLESLPTAAVAREALGQGFAVVVGSLEEAGRASDLIAPEHLQLSVRDPDAALEWFRQFGAVFLGEGSAEVFGDYGAGPNHTLPTGGTARYTAGLSVLTFLRAQTWLSLDSVDGLVEDTAALARLEGLEAHARAAEIRR